MRFLPEHLQIIASETVYWYAQPEVLKKQFLLPYIAPIIAPIIVLPQVLEM